MGKFPAEQEIEMTKTPNADMLEELLEARIEITRINRMAGETVFNPAATDALNGVMEKLQAKAERSVNLDGWLR